MGITEVHLRKRKRFLKRVILLMILAPLVLFLYTLIHLFLSHFLKYDLFNHPFASLVVSVILVSSIYKPIDYLIFMLFKNFLFRSNLYGQVALAQLARDAVSVLDQHELANMIVNTIGEAYDVNSVSILLFDKSKSSYRIISAFGLLPAVWRKIVLNAYDPLVQLLRTRRTYIDVDQVKKLFSWQEANHLTHVLEELHASYVIPLLFNDELIGSINIQRREAVKSLTPQEMRLFLEFAENIAQVFRNAVLMEELKRSNQDLMGMQSDLLRSTQRSAIEHLATGIAHEIHNPLTIISGKAQILLLKRDQKSYDAQVEEVLKTIVKQTRRAADITRKLLMFSETQKSAKESIDLESVINDTIALLSYQVSLDQIQVMKRFKPPMPHFYGNVGELREVFLNLFLNAAQAIGKKGTIEVSGKYSSEDQLFEFRISDTGPGIPEANLSKLFHPFFTTRPEGVGLGLFVTQQIIHGYNGSIRAESHQGRGTVFTIELPLSVEESTSKPDLPATEIQKSKFPSGIEKVEKLPS